MHQIRVAFINELYGTRRQGGEQEVMFALARRLAQRPDLLVEIYSYTGSESKKIETPVPERIKLMPYVRDIFALPKLGQSVEKMASEYDVIHTSATTLFAKQKCPIPYIVSLHAIRSQKAQFLSEIKKYRLVFNPWVKKKLKQMESNCLSQAAKIVALNQRMTAFLEKDLDLDPGKISIIPNAVDTSLFQPRHLNPKRVLFVGRSTVPKGIDTLIKAAPDINGDVIIVTKVASKGVIEKAKKAGIQFHFNIPHQQMPEIYNQAQVFVLPSLDEEQPLTILESMASGLPVVTTEIGSGGMVKDKINGIIIPPRDPNALAEATNQLLADQELYKKISRENRHYVEKNHSWERVINQYVSIYQQIV